LSPQHAGALGNYAKFKMDARHDFISAEELFQRALEADPEHSGNMTSYARMLKKMGRFEQAEGIYKRAMEVDPDNVIMLCNYANFQKKVRGDMEKAKVRRSDEFTATILTRRMSRAWTSEQDAPPSSITKINHHHHPNPFRDSLRLSKELYEMGLEKNPDAEYLKKNFGIFMRDYEKGLSRTGSFKMAKKREEEEARKAKREMEAEEERKREEEKKRREVRLKRIDSNSSSNSNMPHTHNV